jgi:hypothetical protein
MPAKSKAPKQGANAALSARRGDAQVQDLTSASKDMSDA